MKKILLIEDDAQALRTLEKLLASNGFDVATAASGSEALEKIQEQEFALIIADVRMPGMDGIETLKKAGAFQPHARKIVITGYADEDAPLRAIEISVDNYLMKPFEGQFFLKSVQEAFSRYQSEKEKNDLVKSGARAHRNLFGAVLSVTEKRLGQKQGRGMRMARFCACLGEILQLDRRRIENLEKAALCHDLGYLSASEDDWLCANPLLHAQQAAEIAGIAPGYEEAALILKTHHDSFSPSEKETSLERKIVALSEEYENLVVEKGTAHHEALKVLRQKNEQEPVLLTGLSEMAGRAAEMRFEDKEDLPLNPRSWEAMLHLAQIYVMTGLTETAQEILLKIQGGDALQNEEYRFRFLLILSENLLRQGKFAESLRESSAALDLAVSARLGELSVSKALLEASLARLASGRSEEVEGTLQNVESVFEKFGDWRGQAMANLCLGILAFSSGEEKKGKFFLEKCCSLVGADRMPEWQHSHAFILNMPQGKEIHGHLSSFTSSGDEGIKIYSLGSFRAYRNGTLISEEEWKSKRTKQLLIYLLLNLKKPVTEEHLCGVFWPDSDLDRSRKNLHQNIYLLRRILEPSLKEGNQSKYILFEQNTYQFNRTAPFWWDAAELRNNYQEVEKYLGAGEAEKALPHLRQIESLYQGELLEYQVEELWLGPEREKIKEIFIKSLLQLSTIHEERNELDVALELAGCILTYEPLNEQGGLRQIKLMYKSGKRAEAIRRYHDWCGRLKSELNLAPPPELLAFYLEMTGGKV